MSSKHKGDIILTISIVAVSLASFNLGKISQAREADFPIVISAPDGVSRAQNDPTMGLLSQDEEIPENKVKTPESIPVVISVKSKSGVYHYPWCSGAGRISDKNRKEFLTADAAEKAGYTLAANCKK